MVRSRRYLKFSASLVTLFLLGCLSLYAQSPANKPTTATQVPGPTQTVLAAPGAYTGVTPTSPVLMNYVRERDAYSRIMDTVIYSTAAYGDVRETDHYFDGIGRPLQTVNRQLSAGSTPRDIVAPVVYDAFGREAVKYLPYTAQTANTQDGGFKLDPFTDQQNFFQNVYPAEQPAYTGEQVYYGKTIYEPSPLNRVLQTLPPGNSWAGDSVGTSIQYRANVLADSVQLWNISSDTLTYLHNDSTTNIPTTDSMYASGQLYKTVTIDEQGHAVVEFKDKEGQVVLKRVQIGSVTSDFSGNSGWLSTYYVYDILNQLRFVIPPKAVAALTKAGSWTLTSDIVSELCFRYEYDTQKRMIAKKVPGAGWVYSVFDTRNQPVFTQDARMAQNSQWLGTLYDLINRPVQTGMLSYSGNRSQLQAAVDGSTGTSGTGGSGGTGSDSVASYLDETSYTVDDLQASKGITLDLGFATPNGVFFTAEIVSDGGSGTGTTYNLVGSPIPSGSSFIGLTQSFYDDYSWESDKTYTDHYNTNADPGTNTHAEDLPSQTDQQAVQTRGLLTGSKVRVIEDPSNLALGAWLETANFYDDRARLIQTQSDNYRGGHDTLVSRFDFTGKVLSTYLAFTNPTSPANGNLRIKTAMNYDPMGRLLQVYKTINDQDSTKRLLSQSTYDALGQLKQKQLGQLITDGSFLETQNYSYNIRGWLKGINKDYTNNDNSHGANTRWFGLELNYDWGFNTNQLNGNIAGAKWRGRGDGEQRAYGFGYDAANRILFGDFSQNDGSGYADNSNVNFDIRMGDGTTPSTAYDENGNILAMQQYGLKISGSSLIDQLAYHYTAGGLSNKLQNVVDTSNDATTTLGDFRTSANSPNYNGGGTKSNTSSDYNYDVNGNLTRDLNKDIGTASTDGIIYNHLNLPWQVTMQAVSGQGVSGVKGTITYIYDAAGNKLEKRVVDNSNSSHTGVKDTTDYLGTFQYKNDTLQFFGHEEGRVRLKVDTINSLATTHFEYDYFLKDHLGNTRSVLTDEQETDMYPAATMETAQSATEDLYYSQLDATRTAISSISEYPADNTTNPNAEVAKVSGADGANKIGPGITLKVMAGDQFNIRVSSWYHLGSTTPNNTSISAPLTDLVTGLIAGVAGMGGGNLHASPTQLQGISSSIIDPQATDFLTQEQDGANTSLPLAYLNWVLFDNQMNYVASSSGFQQVGGSDTLKQMIQNNLPIDKNGYLYIYLSNSTPNVDVFFDNLQVTVIRGPLTEENHYYPFGLTMAGISDQTLKSHYDENKYRFNKGSELQNKEFSDGSGLEMYETALRELDPQLGRWWQIDSKPDYAQSVYSSMGNNPILRNDPLGDSIPPGLLLPPKSKDGDQTGLIRNATSDEYQENPLRAAGKDFIHLVAEFTGLNAVDNGSAQIRQDIDNKAPASTKAADAISAVVNIGLSTPGEGPREAVKPYEVGMTSDLKSRSVSGDGLDIHHVPQGQPASNIIDNYNYKNAPGIALPEAEHGRIPNLKGTNSAGTPRQQLARDVRNLRNYTNTPNTQIQTLINLVKQVYPEKYLKRK